MILKGSQRGGSAQLAAHLMNDRDNDHVEMVDLRGFISTELSDAFGEARAVASGTKCQQFLFSLSVNPPKNSDATLEDMIDAADRAEEALGLKGQPRACVVHEKDGRRHMHVVWSRIDAGEMKAIPMSHFKNRLAGLSKELYLEHGWELPEGHRENGWKNPLNFTLAEWQQCKRLGLDPKEVKQQFQDAWQKSDGFKAFKAALEDRGYFLARGDRRGFVAVDVTGEVFSVARLIGVKTKDMEARLGSPDRLAGVEQVKAEIDAQMKGQLKEHLKAGREGQAEAIAPLLEQKAAQLEKQREGRLRFQQLLKQRQAKENRERQAKMRRGFFGVWDILTGRAAKTRRENEEEAKAANKRDAELRQRLVTLQRREREELQKAIDEQRRRGREQHELLRERIAFVLIQRGIFRDPPTQQRQRDTSRGPTFI